MKRLSEGRAVFAAIAASGMAFVVTSVLTTAFGHHISPNQLMLEQHRNDDKENVTQGHKLFLIHCAECHGFDARGSDDGPNLFDLREGDGLIRQVITGGVKKEMPAFGKLSDSDVRALIAYLRTLKSRS